MTITAGQRLGPYEIVAPLGAGGMGEVWRAHDTRLDRSVAIKVLPAEFAQNAQLRARFEREAKSISQLNHPHICTLYDVGSENGVEYLVMELLEGETLADRVSRGALPVGEVLRLGAQIADALARAHRQGIVHRDLKPGNIMITRSGAKLLDFGLAKSESVVGLSANSATQRMPITEKGTIVGTFQYMAPEQLEGLEADARTDIFALGAVLYEMATGKRAFAGTSKTSLIAAIVGSEPQPISAVQPLTPPAFEHIVAKCLAKDPEQRWQSAHDVAEELRWISEAGSQAGVAPRIAARHRRRDRARWLLVLGAAVAVAAAAGWLASQRWTRQHQIAPVYRLTIPTPLGSVLGYRAGRMALSPDGRFLAYASFSSEGNMIVLRKLSEGSWRTIEATTGATSPFWSPDSRQIAYFARGALWRVSADGGVPVEITTVPMSVGAVGTWGIDGTILFAGRAGASLFRVNAAGGQANELKLFGGSVDVANPEFLPDGRHFLVAVRQGGTDVTDQYVASRDGSDPPRLVVRGNNNAVYADGYLFFVRADMLYAQPFDARRVTLRGDPQAIAKIQAYGTDPADFSVSGQTLVYLPHGSEVRTELQRVDRGGKALGTIGAPAFYFSPRLSHDGARIAVDESGSDGPGDIWILDVATGASTRQTFSPANESAPVWGAGDTELLYYLAETVSKTRVMRKRVAGGEPTVVYDAPGVNLTADWAPDGKSLLMLTSTRPVGFFRVTTVALPQGTVTQNGPIATAPRFSPDGRWFAYAADESLRGGVKDVFVQPFPPNGSKWQISSDGGVMPVWRRDGKALYYVSGTGRLTEVPISIAADGSIASQAPQPLFGVALREGPPLFDQYDVFPDGTFLLNRIPETASTPMTVVIGWREALQLK